MSRLLAWTREYLERQGVEAARLCAEILLSHALGCERLRLYTQHEATPGADVLDRFRELVREAGRGRPIAYLTGTREFYSLTFEVGPDVLIPRPETEILVERTIALVKKAPAELRSVLDLGTGSGCIAVALARHLPEVRVAASDISDAALAIARRNAARHAVEARIEFRNGDLLDPWDGEQFDLIVCNPPYIATEGAPVEPSVQQHEPALALFAGTDGLGVLRRVVSSASARLRPGGHLLLEVAFDQSGVVRELLGAAGWQDLVAYRDAARHERVVHARRPAMPAAQVA